MADALIAALDCGFALACPAFPANARSVYQGHLFVGGALLNESGMENHPLTPMTDANLVRVLSRQTDGTVGLVPFATVEQGAVAIRDAMTALKEQGRRYAIVDAVSDAHLLAIGEAAEPHALITGGSGVAMGLPANFRRAGRCRSGAIQRAAGWAGHAAVLAGSCSRATLGQLGIARDHVPVLELDPLATPDAARWPRPRTTGWAQARRRAHRHRGLGAAGQGDGAAAASRTRRGGRAGRACARRIAEALVARGVRRLVVAGGETAGAVVSRLGVRRLRIGEEIDPGVPWTFAEGGGAPLLLALKSGNFGARDFFLKALRGAAMTEDETRPLLVELAASLFARGFSVGSAGNISVRLDDG